MKSKLSKKKVGTSLGAIALVASMSFNVYAAVNWGGSQDVLESKQHIVTIQEMFNAKNSTISSLNDTITTLNDSNDTLKTDLAVLRTDNAHLRGKLETANTRIATLETELGTANTRIATLEGELEEALKTGANAKGLRDKLKQAEDDVAELNRLLSEIVNTEEDNK